MTPDRWAQIEELFHRAAECEPPRRGALLDEACANDAELRQHVEALLSSDPIAGGNVQAIVRSEFDAAAFSLTGETVSHYRILSGLGGGGMGLVYRAQDIKLGRTVAIKFLPEDSATDPAALRRFEREARSASALEHPSICPIYEFGEHNGQPFMVMPLLEGQTIEAFIRQQGLPTQRQLLQKLLDIAIQVVKGLESAHDHGIIHRDIKPSNIFLTSDGQAKILDFGVAKLAHAEHEEHNGPDALGRAETARTVNLDGLTLSQTGAVVGTAAYMSPEQARGEPLDARTDLFSFGLVLYEMATGNRAFQRDTGPALQSAVLIQTPVPARELNPGLPPKLAQIITKALEKDRDARYQKASELRADLEILRRGLEPKNLLRWVAILGAPVLSLLIVSTIFWLEKRQSPSLAAPPAIKFRQLTINSSDNPVTSGAISPNGKYLAYVDAQGMHVKDIETGATQPIAEPSAVKKDSTIWEIIDVGWLPDNTRFVVNAHPVGEAPLAWSARTSDIWIFSRLNESPQRLRANARAHSVSPDGLLVAFGANTLWPSTERRFGEREVWFMSANGDQARKAFETNHNSGMTGFLWSPEGHRGIFFNSDVSGSALVSRDIGGGPPVTVLGSDEIPKIRGDLSWLPDGRLIYQAAEPGSETASAEQTCNFWAMRVDVRTGQLIEKPKRLTNWTGFCSSYTNATADGKRIAFLQSSGEHGTAYVADLEAGETRIRNQRHFTLEEQDEFIGDWTADSKAVFVGIIRGDNHYGLFKQSLGSTNPVPIVATAEGGMLVEAILSPDGKWIIALIWPPVGGPSPSNPSAPLPLMRIPVAGGTPEPMFQIVRPGPYSCARAPSNLCVVPERTSDQKQVTVTAFDPVKGRGAELARFDLGRDMNFLVNNLLCVLSPDGTRLAFAPSPDGPIEIHSLRHQPTFVVPAKSLDKLWNIQWAADSNALLVSRKIRDGVELLHVDMQGKTTRLWKSMGPRGYGVPSPDGRHLAIYDWKRSSNMWMMENF
jgi:serine/threonine protein kinase